MSVEHIFIRRVYHRKFHCIRKYLSSSYKIICGYYIGLKLLKQHGEKAAMRCVQIHHLWITPESGSIELIEEDCMFDVSDDAFLLFFAIEEAMRGRLIAHMKKIILVQ